MSETTIQHSQNFVADCTKCYWNDLFGTVQQAYEAADSHVAANEGHRVLVYEATVIFKG